MQVNYLNLKQQIKSYIFSTINCYFFLLFQGAVGLASLHKPTPALRASISNHEYSLSANTFYNARLN